MTKSSTLAQEDIGGGMPKRPIRTTSLAPWLAARINLITLRMSAPTSATPSQRWRAMPAWWLRLSRSPPVAALELTRTRFSQLFRRSIRGPHLRPRRGSLKLTF